MTDPLAAIPAERPVATMPRPPSEEPKPAVERHLWEITAVRDVLWLTAGVCILWVLYSLRSIFVPIFTAILLAYLANPLIGFAQRKWSLPRPVTVSLLLLLFSLATAALVMGIGPLVTDQIQTLIKKAPAYVSSLNQRLGNIEGLSAQIEATLSTLKEDPLSFLRPFVAGTGQAFGLLGTMIGRTLNFALVLFLVPLYFFFFGWHFNRMLATLSQFIPRSRRERVYGVLNRMDAAVSGFFHERLLIAVITGAMYAIGWAATDVPYWFLLGAGTGLLSLIPYVSAVGWPLAVLLKYLDSLTGSGQFGWIAIVVWPSVAYLIVQFIESWILTPWIQRRSSDMSAVTLLIVMFIGGAVGGLFGLILCIPVAACIKILFEEFLLPKWSRWAALQ
jgi:predicted PurR-regulated permease PerM